MQQNAGGVDSGAQLRLQTLLEQLSGLTQQIIFRGVHRPAAPAGVAENARAHVVHCLANAGGHQGPRMLGQPGLRRRRGQKFADRRNLSQQVLLH